MDLVFTEYKYPITSGGRDIDVEKANAYVRSLPDDYKKIMSAVLAKMKYVTFDEFMVSLRQCFASFSQTIGNKPFHILFDGKKIGSSQWLVNMLQADIEKLNFKGFINGSYTGPVGDILIIDDFSCTGVQIVRNTIETFITKYFYSNYPITDINDDVDDISADVVNLDRLCDVTFHLVVPYVSHKLKSYSSSIMQSYDELVMDMSCVIYAVDEKISTFADIWSLLSDNGQLSSQEGFIIYNSYKSYLGIDDMNACLVYFDHKMGNKFASMTNVLLKGKFKDTYTGSLLQGAPDESGKKAYVEAVSGKK